MKKLGKELETLKGKKAMVTVMIMVILMQSLPMIVCANDAVDVSAVTKPFDVITALAFAATKAIGIVVAIFGISDAAAGFNSHDTSQQKQGLMKIFTGLILFFSKLILSLMGM